VDRAQLRAAQKPIEERCRREPEAALLTLKTIFDLRLNATPEQLGTLLSAACP